MRKKIIIPILIIFTISYITANLIYTNYKYDVKLDYKIYYLERKIIDDKSNSKKVNTENNKTIYVGITTNYSNALKIQKMYEESNINISIKEEKVNDIDLISEITQYDILLASTDNKQEIKNILETMMATYEENLNEI